jgi:hypothetical protein
MAANFRKLMHETFTALGVKFDEAISTLSTRLDKLEATVATLTPPSPQPLPVELVPEGEVIHSVKEQTVNCQPSELWFHGDCTRHTESGGYFFHYPEGVTLPNKWDTHLPPSTFCSNHKRGHLRDGEKGQKHYICCGHTSLPINEEVAKEWESETYNNSHKPPLWGTTGSKGNWQGGSRKGIYTKAQHNAWKQIK